MAASEFDDRQGQKNAIANVSPSEMFSLIDERFRRWVDLTAGLRNEWRLTNMFAQGFQWSVLQPSQGRIVQPPTARNRRRITLDLIGPWMLDTEAKLAINLPTFDVSPNTLAQVNKDAAQAGEGYGQHLWRQMEMKQKYWKIVRYAETFGHCFGVLDFDETIGPLYERRKLDASGQPILQDGAPVTEPFVLGDMRFDIFGPNNVITDEEPTELDDKPYILLASWMSLDNIREKWDEGKHVQAESRARPQYDALDMASATTGMREIYRHTPGDVPGAIVFKLLMKPQTSAAKGLIVEIANNVELSREKEWPSYFDKMDGYPVVKFDWFQFPQVFRGTSPIIRQMPIQREINITMSQIRESMDMVLAAKWLNPFGSGVEDIDDIAGQIVDYVPGFKPELVQPQGVPTFVIRYLQDLLTFMEDVQMLHKPSKGKVPAGVKSGVGIELLQEQDDRPLSVPENSLHDGLDKTFRKALQIASMAIDTERMISYVGPNRRRQVMAFKGADLRDNTNIHLQVVGGSSKSKAGIVKRIMEFVQIGLYRKEGGEVDTKRIMDMIRTAHPDVLYEDEDRHADLARDENDILWDAAQPIPRPQEWEMHSVHLDEHEEEMTSIKWKQQAQADESWAKRWLAHRELHIQFRLRSISRNQVAAQNAAPAA